MFGKRKRRQEEERSASGSPIYRHQASDRDWTPPADGDEGVHQAIEAHYEAHLGPCETVLHEIVSDLVHLDVYHWPPTPDRPVHTFATVGMSDRPMAVPDGALEDGAARRAELLVCLPEGWPVPSQEVGSISPWEDEDNYFPIRWLKQLARLPHEYDTWLGFGHTVPNGDPPRPLADTTGLSGWVLLPPMSLPASGRHVELPDGSTLDLFGIVALHPDELDRKLADGIDALYDGFDEHGVSEVLDIRRPSSLGPVR